MGHPQTAWRNLFNQARQKIGILAYSALFLAEDHSIPRSLTARAEAEAHVRILLGDPEAAKREGLRSKLKRLVERGWAREEGPRLFMVTEPVAHEVSAQGDGGLRDGIAPSSASSPGG